MNIQALNNTTPLSAAAILARPTGNDFLQQLRGAEAQAGELPVVGALETDGLDQDKAKALRKASEQLVATTFIQPMLSKLREDPFKTDMFHGGQTEEIFGQRLDTIMSERIVAKADFAIVDAVYRSIAKQAMQAVAASPEVDQHA
jgi:hypothetical protein